MRIVIEDFPYPEERLRNVLPERMLGLPNKNGEIRPPYVGYCFNPRINDCIFFLPKVVLTKDRKDKNDVTGRGLVFDHYDPIDLLDFDKSVLDEADRKFLQKFAIWIYRAINIFYKNNDTSIISSHTFLKVDASTHKKEGTLIDSILSLLQFARDNREFVMFEIKNIHRGYNRVNWHKTVSHQQPIRQGKSPIYLNPINKKKQIDSDEELFVIFFSILRHIHDNFGFPAEININYDTIKRNEFRKYLNGYGKTRLRQIKYKYFSDNALKLWHLCYSFFDDTERFNTSSTGYDFLIAKDFNIVFESIIETLLGEKLPRGFKSQNDGKIVDHIYPYDALVNPQEQIYHIADSKYYKIGASMGKEAIYKQFTYAKNVIQLTFDILFETDNEKNRHRRGYLPYRDSLTEGYNITPNFFISAKIKKDDSRERYSFSSDNLMPHENESADEQRPKYRIIQFHNRLFDRDTLILSHYDINFLYLIALYGKNNHSEQSDFRRRARNVFRNYIIELLERYYLFYRIDIPSEKFSEFVESHFRELNGKLYHFDNTLIMALDRYHEKTPELIEKYRDKIVKYILLKDTRQ